VFFNCRSATVDASLFARYFGDCPVITVEGRTHPVSTHFLEDVYEKMEYCLALDSPASGAYFAQHGEKVFICPVLILNGVQSYPCNLCFMYYQLDIYGYDEAPTCANIPSLKLEI
jgi:hypothetical protein